MLFVSRVVDQLQLQIALNTTHVTLTETLPKNVSLVYGSRLRSYNHLFVRTL